MKKTYPWTRFWIPRDEELALFADAYLPDPEDAYSRFYNPRVSTFSAISERACNVLLGEGGMGKSRSLQKDHALLVPTWAAQKGIGVLIDLGDVGSLSDLNLRLVQNKSVQDWLNGKGLLHLSLDSLDEALPRFPTLPKALLDELKNFPKERLRLAIACRTGEWPIFFEDGLGALYGADNVSIWQMTPLRQEDVRIAARENNLDPERLLMAIGEKELAPLAAHPLTLDWLLRSGTDLPDDVSVLYERGCTALVCEDPESSRYTQRPRMEASQKMAVAERIACISLFGARAAISTEILKSGQSDAVLLQDVAGGTETADGNSFGIGTVDVREVLLSGLFTGDGLKFRWAHKSYAEFLAARRLRIGSASLKQVMTLIGCSGRVAPALAGVAAWLASMREDVRGELLSIDPEILLDADAAATSQEHRVALVAWLVRQAEASSPFIYQWGLFWKFRKLRHDQLKQQLEPLLGRARKESVRSLAVKIADACGGVGLTDALTDVALRTTEPTYLRIAAASCVASHGSIAEKARLIPLALKKVANKEDERLQAAALSASWPEHLSWAQVRDSLGNSDHEQTGALGRFLANDFARGMPVNEISGTLTWLADKHANPSALSGWAGAADQLIIRAMSLAYDEGLMRSIADLLVARIVKHFHMFDQRAFRPEQMRSVGPLQLRHAVAAEVISRLAGSWHSVTEALRNPIPLLLRSDVAFAIESWTTAPAEKKPAWEAVIGWLIDWESPEDRAAVFQLVANLPELRRALVRWHLRRREGTRVEQSHRIERESRLERKKSARIRLLRHLLRRSERSAPHFGRLVELMSAGLDDDFASQFFNPNIRTLPGWPVLTEPDATRLIEAGKLFLEDGSSYRASCIRHGTLGRNEMAAYKTMRELSTSDPAYMNRLPQRVWTKWIHAIVLFQAIAGEQEYADPDRRLLELAIVKARAVVNWATALVLRADKMHEPERVLGRLARVIPPTDFDGILYAAIAPRKTSEALYVAGMNVLFGHAHAGAQRLVRDQLRMLNRATKQERARIAYGAAIWLEHAREQAWPTIWKILKANPAFVKLLLAISNWGGRKAALEWLPDRELRNLYCWLRAEFGPTPGDYAFKRDPVHDLEAGILVWLQQRRAVTAIFVLEGLEQKYRSDWWIRKAVWEARRLLLKSTWEPLAPEVTKRVIEDREHMLVRDEAEFMEAVWEALHEFQTRIRDAGDRIRRLWNEYHIGGVMVYQPKPEEPLSREIALSLHDLLRNRGVSAHLESKIREGEYVDVLVSTVTAGSKPRPVSLIIEVKGCWNPGVRSSLRKQLAERYLKENSSGFGIYLVVQFLCEAWDQRDNREKKAWKESLSGMRTFLKAQAERVNSATQSSIRAFVLDASLPDSWSKTGHKAKKVSARKETASVKHQSSKSVRRTKKPASKR